MRFKIVLLLWILGITNAFSQESTMFIELKSSILKNDSLQKQVSKLNLDINKLISARDSISIKFHERTTSLEKEIAFQKKINEDLSSQINKQEIQIADLKKEKLRIERDKIKAKNDSLLIEIIKFRNIIDSTQKLVLKEKELGFKQITELKDSNAKLLIQEKEKKKEEVLGSIIKSYQKPFAELLKIHSKASINRDLEILGDKTEVQPKIEQLQVYFDAEELLRVKLNLDNINAAKNKLSKLEQAEQVIGLAKRLEYYSLKNEGLQNVIDKIILNDKKFNAIEKGEHNDKLKDIALFLMQFYSYYEFNISEYPYLAEIIIEINNLKQKDSNTDIKALKDKL